MNISFQRDYPVSAEAHSNTLLHLLSFKFAPCDSPENDQSVWNGKKKMFSDHIKMSVTGSSLHPPPSHKEKPSSLQNVLNVFVLYSFCLYEVNPSHSCVLSFNRLLAFICFKQSDFLGQKGNRGGWGSWVRDKGALGKGRGVEVVTGREECILMLF